MHTTTKLSEAVHAALQEVGECKRILNSRHPDFPLTKEKSMELLARLQAVSGLLAGVPEAIKEAEAAAAAAAEASLESEVAKIEAATAALPQPTPPVEPEAPAEAEPVEKDPAAPADPPATTGPAS
jgi:hypothetical protein